MYNKFVPDQHCSSTVLTLSEHVMVWWFSVCKRKQNVQVIRMIFKALWFLYHHRNKQESLEHEGACRQTHKHQHRDEVPRLGSCSGTCSRPWVRALCLTIPSASGVKRVKDSHSWAKPCLSAWVTSTLTHTHTYGAQRSEDQLYGKAHASVTTVTALPQPLERLPSYT